MINESDRTAGDVLPRGQPINVLIVDDSSSFLVTLIRYLEQRPELKVIGVSHSGLQAVEQVAISHPDLVLMDVKMAEMNGLEATIEIKARPKAPRVILMTVFDTLGYRKAAVDAGADGFVGKSRLRAELFPSIEKLFSSSRKVQT